MRRSIIWTLRLVGAFAVLVVLTFIGMGSLLAYRSIDKEDGFFVRNAALLDPNYLISRETRPRQPSELYESAGVSAHRLKLSPGVVLGYRFYSGGDPLSVDDETYVKITVWLPHELPQTTTEVALGDASRALVIYSRGGSAWPERGCSGFVNSGRLRIAAVGKRYSVSVVGRLEHRAVHLEAPHCTTEPVEVVFEAAEIPFAQLTPWLGREGSHPYDETYRR